MCEQGRSIRGVLHSSRTSSDTAVLKGVSRLCSVAQFVVTV